MGPLTTLDEEAEEIFKHHMSASDPPYAAFEKLFTDEECDTIIKFGLDQQLQDATISTGRSKDDDTRRGQVGIFHGNQMAWVHQRVLDAMSTANKHSWKYNLPESTASASIELMQFSLYDHSKKAFYDFHADNGFIGSPHENRKLSLTVQLSDGRNYTGGKLLIRPSCVQVPGEDLAEPATASSNRGAAIVFPSCLSHMVTPVTERRRYSLVQWVQTSDAPPDSDNMAKSHLRDARIAMDALKEKAATLAGEAFLENRRRRKERKEQGKVPKPSDKGKEQGKAKIADSLYPMVEDIHTKFKRLVQIWPADAVLDEVVTAFKEVHRITNGDSRVQAILNEFSKPLPRASLKAMRPSCECCDEGGGRARAMERAMGRGCWLLVALSEH
jgi:predicted 2-oxoglutarate/Fe(II)-dependent dioxygenase YbiX